SIIFRDNRIEFADPAICDVLGYTFEELRALKNPDMVFRYVFSGLSLADMFLCVADETTPRQCELKALHKDGSSLRLEGAIRQVIYEGEPALRLDLVEGSGPDANALRTPDEGYRIISELVSDYAYLYRVETDGTWSMDWLVGSPAEFLGYDVRELSESVRPFHPEDTERANKDVELTLQGQPTESDYRVVTKSGQLRWVHIRRKPVWDPVQKRIGGFYAAVRDITERKLAEQQRLELALERQRVKLLRDFIGHTSHDLKTPLSVIKTNIYLHERLNDPEMQKRRLDIIKGQALHLENLIAENLTNAEVEGVGEPRVGLLDVNTLVADLKTRFAPLAAEQMLSLEIEPGDAIPTILGDEQQINRALVNLVENALRYTP